MSTVANTWTICPARREAPGSRITSAPPAQRLLSIDALRGFVMFLLMGGREMLLALIAILSEPLATALQPQFNHASWVGFTVWDAVMPLFLFLVGAAMPFAIAKRQEQGEPLKNAYWRIARRVALLWILGMVAQGSLMKWDFWKLEFYSNTLQAIALGYLFTALALLHLSLRAQVLLCAGCVIVYAALVQGVPFAGYPAGTLEKTANLPLYIDQLVLGPFRREHPFTWVLSTIGFTASVMLGSFAGLLLRSKLSPQRKLAWLVGLGVALAAIGWLWSYQLPLNRHVWTSSMTVWMGGLGFLTMALFYLVIDIYGWKAWTFPFVVVGANALLAYVISHVYDRQISDVLVKDLAERLTNPLGELVQATACVGLLWVLLWFLYKQRVFLRA